MASEVDCPEIRRSAYRAPGRPLTAIEIAALVVRFATENQTWGYLRIQGALANVGHKLARNTIANILKEHGIEPAPERSRRTTWKDFLSRHLDQIVATDFFTVEVWTSRFMRLSWAGTMAGPWRKGNRERRFSQAICRAFCWTYGEE